MEESLRSPFDWSAHADKNFDRERIVGWLEQIGRGSNFLDLHLKNLSGGESQITALLRAIQLDPQVLLLDEPTSGLDPQSTRLVETLVANWLSEDSSQRAYIWVTHDSDQAERIAGQIWRMEDGQLNMRTEAPTP